MPPPADWRGWLDDADVAERYAKIPTYDFDLDKAKAELEQSAFASGFSGTLVYDENFPQLAKAALNLAENMAKLGGKIDVKQITGDEWFAVISGPKDDSLNMTAGQLGTDYNDPGENIYLNFQSKFAVNGAYNFANYKNPELDKLLDEQLAMPAHSPERADKIVEVLNSARHGASAAISLVERYRDGDQQEVRLRGLQSVDLGAALGNEDQARRLDRRAMSIAQVGLFLIQRVAVLSSLLVLVSFVVFLLLYLAPGDTAQILLGPKPQSPAALAAVRAQYHLDEPLLVQYWLWLKGAIHGDLGRSIRTNEPIAALIGARVGIDLFLGFYAFVLAMVVGVPLGIIAAVRRRSAVDRLIVGVSVMGVSAPPFASGLLLLYIFVVYLHWFPAFGAGHGFLDRLSHLTLPAIALALTAMALVVKLTRAGMVGALEQDYIVFARARGLPTRKVLLAYAFRNALVPVVTSAGLIFGYLLTGGILVEVAFSLPGVGALMIDGVSNKDLPWCRASH